MNGERSFNADTVRNSSDGEGFSDAAVLLGDNDTFVVLNSLFCAFDNLNGNFYRVAYRENGNFVFKVLFLDLINNLRYYATFIAD